VAAPRIIVLMGVSGCGKTTVGAVLAQQLGAHFLEGDTLHPPENIAKMQRGEPLTDADRWPWLHAVAEMIDDWRARGISGVVACSALKRAYRKILIGAREDVRLVYLRGTREMIATRLAARRGHFMPAALLDSQFSALEEPASEENAIVVAVDRTPEEMIEELREKLA
jgi:gluconokinase